MSITIRTPILNNTETSDNNLEEEEEERERLRITRRNMYCIGQTVMSGLACIGFTFILYIISKYP